MPAPVHARIRLGGSIYRDAQWSVGCAFSSAQGTDPFANGTFDATAVLNVWRDNVRAMAGGNVIPDAWRNALGAQVQLEWIRCSRIGLDGKESHVALVQLDVPVKGAGGGVQDAQSAIALSLLSGRPGGSYRGRMFLPAQGVGLTDGRVSTAQTGALATATGVFLKGIQDAAADFDGVGAVRPCIVSPTRGALTVVTGIRVGNRLDSQRRRAEAQEEIYSVAPVPQ